jgi:parallel beta-helix repeat protein
VIRFMNFAEIKSLLTVVLCLGAVPAASGAIRQVGPGQTYTTIQACLDAAVAGDTCEVHTATYSENASFKSSGVILQVNPGDTVTLKGTIDILSYADSVVDGFNITGYTTSTGGIHAYNTSGGIIRNNVVHDSTNGAGIYVRLCKDFQVYGNTSHDIGGTGGSNGQGMFIISANSTDDTYAHGMRIYNNEIYQSHQDGLNINGNYISVHDNYIHDNAWAVAVHPDGIECNGSADGYLGCLHTLVYNNLVKNQTQNVYFQSLGTPAQNGDIWIFNNVLYNDPVASTGLNMSTGSSSYINLNLGTTAYIFNNTFGGTVQYFDILIGDGTGRNDPSQAFTDVHIKNNIITSSSYIGLWTYPSTNVAELDYDLYYNNQTALVHWGTTNLTSISSVRSATGMEGHGQEANPLINAFPTPTLQSGSPAIRTGANLDSLGVAALDSDKAGTARPNPGAWDVGAYQFTTGSKPAPPTNLKAIVH